MASLPADPEPDATDAPAPPRFVDRHRLSTRIWQPIGSNGDFVSIAGHYNQNRNNFFGSLPIRQDLTRTVTIGGVTLTVPRIVGPNSQNRYPRNRGERFYDINYPCQVDIPQPGVADSPSTSIGPGTPANDPFGHFATCGTEFDRRYNPSNTGNIRGSSKFTLMDNLVLTVDPSLQFVKANGGTVSGAVRHPLATTDYSSFLLQAQSSGAKVIGLANAGLDTSNSIKQAAEFGIVAGGQRLAALLFTLAEVHGLGLEAAQGLTLTEGFYWNRTPEAAEFGKRFFDRTGAMPNMVHAGTYSAVLQYLKAIEKAGTDETEAVAKALHEMPVNDVFAENGKVGANGRMIHDMYLMEVKKPGESDVAWDYYKVLATIPGEEAFIDPAKSGCPLVSQ